MIVRMKRKTTPEAVSEVVENSESVVMEGNEKPKVTKHYKRVVTKS